MRILLSLLIILTFLCVGYTQNVVVSGYVFEEGNRGYLNQVEVDIIDKSSGKSIVTVSTDPDGFFEVTLMANVDYVANAEKQLFENKKLDFDTKGIESEGKKFIKIQMTRERGYDFEVTLAPKRDSEDIPVDAIKGAWIEVYNNTTEQEVLNLKDHDGIEFKVHFDKGNYYTIMVRKEGFFTKRMEAHVNIDGCILCFEGIGNVKPGVVDNLSDGNAMGVLLANVELEPLFSGKTFEVKNIYYDLGKSTLRPEAIKSLKNLATVLIDNPHIQVELGSHTDSRGDKKPNQTLSEDRAKAAVDFLIYECDVDKRAILAVGYGEEKLINDCIDDVYCSEADHQKNRRTELKVLTITDSNRTQKTLAQIRVEEEFIKSVMSGNVEQRNDVIEVKKTNEDLSGVAKRGDSKVTMDKNNEAKKAIVVSEEVSIDEVKEDGEETVLVQKVDEEVPSSQVIIAVDEAKTIKKKLKLEEKNIVERGTVSGQKKVYQQYLANKYKFGTYTGFKVVIQFSKDPISTDHEIFKRHDDIAEFRARSGSMLYMIGEFDKKSEAEDFLNKTVLFMYPGAYLIEFMEGKRLN